MINRSFRITVTVLITYFFTGYLGLLLAVPPGFATTVWPPSGIAIASVLLFGRPALLGVFLGAITLNFSLPYLTSESGATNNALTAILSAAPIAIGSTLQAWLGAYFIRRCLGFPIRLSNFMDISILSIIAGPLTCVVAPTIGVASLVLNGVISPDVWSASWLNWWIGDSVGALVFSPILLIVLGRQSESITNRRKKIASTAFLSVFILAVLAFSISRSMEVQRIEKTFNEQVFELDSYINKSLKSVISSIRAYKGLYVASSSVNEEEFSRFFTYVEGESDVLRSVSWLELVTEENRVEFEARMSAEGYPETTIWGILNGNRVTLPPKEIFYPVKFNIRSSGVGRDIIGYDPTSDVAKNKAIQAAIQSNDVTAGKPTHLVSRPEEGYSVILYLPVFEKETMAEVPKESLLGVIASIFDVDTLFDSLAARDLGIAATVTDITSLESFQVYDSPNDNNVQRLSRIIVKDFSGRQWKVEYYATGQYFKKNRDRVSIWVLTTSMIFTWILTVLILLITGYDENIRREVVDKTEKLNQALGEAKYANKAKSRFLASMSHELRTPLNSVIGFTVRLMKNEKLITDSDPRVSRALDAIHKNGKQLLELINDLLDVSKVETGRMELLMEETDVHALVDDIILKMSPLAEEKQLGLTSEVLMDERLVCIDKKKVSQILMNLLSNGIKYTDSGNVRLTADYVVNSLGRGVQFVVSDTGNGIPDSKTNFLFKPYTELHKNDTEEIEGTGLGLALVKAFTDLHGGTIRVTSEKSVGSQFTIWIPVK